MRIKIEQFLRNYGIRTAGEILRPRLFHQSKLILPHQSTYHFLDSNTSVLGPNQNDPLINRLKGKVFIEHKTHLNIVEGNPIRTSVIANSLVMEFRRNNRFFKLLRKDESVKINTQNVPIFNYNMLNRLYRYQTNMKSNYFRWKNINHTFWNGVVDVAQRFGWNQFIEIELPREMPTYGEFRRIEKGLTKDILNIFNDDAKLNLMEIIKFVGPNQRESELFQLLQSKSNKDGTVVNLDIINKINFIVRVKNNFFIINLGKLFEYRDNSELIVSNEEFNIVKNTASLNNDNELLKLISNESFEQVISLEAFKPNVLQLRLISLFTTLVEYNSGTENEVVEAEVVNAPKKETANIEDDDIEYEDLDDELLEIEVSEVETPPETEDTEEDLTDEEVAQTTEDTKLTQVLDLDTIIVTHTPPPSSELEETVLIVERDPVEKERDVTIVKSDPKAGTDIPETEIDDPNVKAIAETAKSLVDVGAISAYTYESVIEQAKTYLKLDDPYGSGKKLSEAMTVTEDDLKIPEVPLKASNVISDESMKHEVHRQMKTKYINEVLPKDILRSIVSVQKSGVTVLNVKSEVVEDALDHYREFHVQLKPIRGKVSTVSFRIPEIDDQGRFKANGVTYYQRTQVGDIPIRKVNPTKVALTSYYQKVFVDRSSLAVNDFDKWLHRNLVKLSMVKDEVLNDFRIKNLKINPKNYANLKLPRIYTRLANQIDGFDTKGYKYHFNYETRESLLKGDIKLETLEKKQYVFCGTKGNKYILAGYDESFYLTENGKDLEPLDNIVDILELDLSKAPVEMVTVNIKGKNVPLGFVLCYRNGLSGLLESLKVEYVTHQRGTRIKLANDEFTLTFMDEVLVFNRSDYKTNLIIGGLRTFNKILRTVSRWDLDRKDAYYRLAESRGLGTRHIRGIDELYSSWLDPITEDILKDMGEPTDFERLLYRALELLQTDWSPDEVDGAYLRYKGYERMAGTIYNTLTKAANRYNAAQGRGLQVIQINPYEVWSKITTDPTVSVVEDINPIQTIREQEVVTFSGEGGRSSKTLVARTRAFHENALGVASEATVDSGNAGAVYYMVPDANFTNIRGVTKTFDKDKDGAAKIFSTAALVSVGTEHDDKAIWIKNEYNYSLYLNNVPIEKWEFPLIAGTSLELIILQ